MNFGAAAEEDTSHSVMDTALDAGVNFFDTANVYGSFGGHKEGRTEEILGTWFAEGDDRRGQPRPFVPGRCNRASIQDAARVRIPAPPAAAAGACRSA